MKLKTKKKEEKKKKYDYEYDGYYEDEDSEDEEDSETYEEDSHGLPRETSLFSVEDFRNHETEATDDNETAANGNAGLHNHVWNSQHG